MAHSALPEQPSRDGAAGPNQWIKDDLDALIDARLLPDAPHAVPHASRRSRAAARLRRRPRN